jgi:alkylation response protein AidB-like acyl-CoA dehydrogenase
VNALLDRVDLMARETGAFDDAAFADRLARARIDAIAFSAAFARQLELMRVAGSPGQASSLLKIVNTDLQQRLADLLLEAAGSAGASLAFIEAEGRRLHPALTFLQARRNTIYGGTSEIQRNIVARRLLDLGNDKRGERA